MEPKLERQLVSLSTFVEDFLAPAIQRHATTSRLAAGRDADFLVGSSTEREQLLRRQFGPMLDHSRASLYEGYLWLYLGVEWGFFPRSQSEEVARAALRELPGPPAKFLAFLPGALRLVLDSAFRKQTFFVGMEPSAISDSHALSVVFQSLLGMINAFEEDGISQSLVAAMTFSDVDTWAQLMKTDVSYGRVEMALRDRIRGPVEPSKETLVAGFFRAIAFMGNFLYLFDELRREPVGPEDPAHRQVRSLHDRLAPHDVALIERRTKELCFWRLNFLDEVVSKRFGDLETVVAAVIGNAVKDSAGKLPGSYHPRSFYQQVSILLDRWRMQGQAHFAVG